VAIGALVIVALVLLGVGLSAVVVYNGDDFSLLRGRRYTPLLVDVAYRRRVFEILLDVFLIAIAYYVAYVVRFDAELAQHRVFFEQSLPVVIACQLSSSFVAGVYRGFWRYISVSELPIYIRAVVVGSVSSVLALVYVYRFEGYSRSVFVIYAMTIGLLLVGSRLFFRLLGEGASRSRHTLRPALLYGAGDAGALLVRELLNNESRGLRPVAFLDDDHAKLGRSVLGVPIIGSFENLSVMVTLHRPEVLIVSTALPYERLAAIAQIVDRTGIDLLRFDFRLQPLRIEEPLVAYAETHLSHK
jgi:UDP-GlcNAc:undecaprenyl-phosphate GlcNAc-1-phosphate transferase